MRITPFAAIFAIFIIILACQPQAEPIDYGYDACSFCKMNIVDHPFASELVTKKGKVHKYDAIECLVADINKNGEGEYELVLVHDFSNPKEWVDARSCIYLVSKKLPSPMGAFISAHVDQKTALKIKNEAGGEFYDWPAIKEYVSKGNFRDN